MYRYISGFADEIDKMVDKQFEVLNKLGIKYFEPRFVDGKNISEFTEEEAHALKEKMDKHGIEVSSVGSPIGKIKISGDFESHFEVFKNTVKVAKIIGAEYIRIFSFYPDEKGNWSEDDIRQIFEKLGRMIEYAKAEGIILLHENEKDIYGESAENCLELMERLYCDNFKAVFDPANFVQSGVDTKKAYDMLYKYIEYMHIKDAYCESGRVVPAGMGDGNVEYILTDLFEKGYRGYLSLEPHLGSFEGLADLELGDEMMSLPKSGEGTFEIAYNALCKIVERIGVE